MASAAASEKGVNSAANSIVSLIEPSLKQPHVSPLIVAGEFSEVAEANLAMVADQHIIHKKSGEYDLFMFRGDLHSFTMYTTVFLVESLRNNSNKQPPTSEVAVPTSVSRSETAVLRVGVSDSQGNSTAPEAGKLLNRRVYHGKEIFLIFYRNDSHLRRGWSKLNYKPYVQI